MLESVRIFQMAVVWPFAAAMHTARPPAALPGLRVAVLTTIVPSSEPVSILEQTFPTMRAIRHSEPFDVWVLDEGDDPEVKAMCERFGIRHFSRKGVERYNQPDGAFKARTKAGNHNAWRDQHASEYDVVAQMDPDHIPEPEFLETTLGYVSDPDVAYVIAPQVDYRNARTSWIARGADWSWSPRPTRPPARGGRGSTPSRSSPTAKPDAVEQRSGSARRWERGASLCGPLRRRNDDDRGCTSHVGGVRWDDGLVLGGPPVAQVVVEGARCRAAGGGGDDLPRRGRR